LGRDEGGERYALELCRLTAQVALIKDAEFSGTLMGFDDYVSEY
jgi:hypothetical protein